MANTYSQIYVHFVFAVQSRISLIRDEWKNELYKYMTGVIEQQGHKLFQINGMPDHVHVLVSMNCTQSLSDLMYHVKRSSSSWVNQKRLVPGRFSWQEGFGAFSYGKSQIGDVIRYIENQEEHHKTRSFMEEYVAFLKAFDVEFDERYVFKSID
ncbi:IS200/IS605 family transposase [Pinibacter aurantiacus]|uniref:IS200/IS605 family transposase n=1 Tax=Pinibacter aurantiacus TaxID=2851599 RepID=A0A9E2W4A1_9BACT|nr:IS200/IS605 family transposase [Pinibacter aurantiacus]MBV4357634.1 IS200/IS605 family transposase [Pinibacter aurantiacus]